MKRGSRWLLTLPGAWVLSLFLIADSFSFALAPYDPATGRARGCYTAIERLLDLKEPSGWIRGTEQGLGALLFFGCPIVLGVGTIRWALARRRQKHAV